MDWRELWRGLRYVGEMAIIVIAVAAIGWGVVNIMYGIPLIYKTMLRVEAKLSAVDAACVIVRKDQEQIK